MILTVKRVTKSFTDKKDNRSGNKNNQSQNNKGDQGQSKSQNSETKQPNSGGNNNQGQPEKGRKWKRKGNMPMSESNSGRLSEEEYKKLKEKIKKELEEEGKKKGEDVLAKYKKGLLYTGGGLATVGALGTGYYLYNKKKQADRKNRYGLNY